MCTDQIHGGKSRSFKQTIRRAAKLYWRPVFAVALLWGLGTIAAALSACSNKTGSIGVPSFGQDGMHTHQEVTIGGHKFARSCITKYQADGSVQVNCNYARADGQAVKDAGK